LNHKGTVKLETERLLLRRFIPDDLEPMFYNCWNNQNVWKWTSYEPMNSIDDVLTLNNIFTEFWFAKYNKDDFYNWAIELKETNELIGRFRGMNPDDRVEQIELAYELGQNWWNNGYTTEAAKAVISFFFDEVGFCRIYAHHAAENLASGKVMQKCGMICEGITRKGKVCNAGKINAVNYAILAEDYFNDDDIHIRMDGFWSALDKLVSESTIAIDRSKGVKHPRFDFIYPLDYGYLENTSSMDGSGIDIWHGSLSTDFCDALICTVDLMKNDSEIKLLLGCTEEEKEIVMRFHNDSQYMKGVMIRRNEK